MDECESTCNGCGASSSENSIVTGATSDNVVAVPTSLAAPSNSGNVVSTAPSAKKVNTTVASTSPTTPGAEDEYVVIVAAREVEAPDENDDRSVYFNIILITLIASGACFLIIITAVVSIACCRAARKRKLKGLKKRVIQDTHVPTTNTQQTSDENKARDPDHMPPNTTVSVVRSPVAGTPSTPYPDGYMSDPGYETATDCEGDQKGNHVLNLDKFHLRELAMENGNSPIDRRGTTSAADNVSDIQTVVIKVDTSPPPPTDDGDTSANESYYPCSSISTLHYGN